MEALSVAYIRLWLSKLIVKGKVGRRNGLTLVSLAHHTAIPHATLCFLASDNEAAAMSFYRQMLLSKIISQVENGEVEFVPDPKDGRRSIVVKAKKKPTVRYAAKVIGGQARLAYVDRPKPFRDMPAFKDLWLG